MPGVRLSRAGIVAFALAAGCDAQPPTATRDPAPPVATAQPTPPPSVQPDGDLANLLGTVPSLGTGTGIGAAYGAPAPPSTAKTSPVDLTVAVISAKGIADAKPALEKVRFRMRTCAQRAAMLDPLVAGKVTLALEADAAGAVSSSKVTHSTTSAAGLDACLAAVSKTARFGGAGSVTVELTVTAKP